MPLSDLLSGHQLDSVLDSLVVNSWNSVMVTQAAPKTPIVYVNDAFTKLTGYTPTDVVGKSPAILQGEKTDQAVLDRLRDDLAAGRVFEGAAVNYRKDGSEFLMKWRVIPVPDDQGKPIYYLALQQQGQG